MDFERPTQTYLQPYYENICVSKMVLRLNGILVLVENLNIANTETNCLGSPASILTVCTR